MIPAPFHLTENCFFSGFRLFPAQAEDQQCQQRAGEVARRVEPDVRDAAAAAGDEELDRLVAQRGKGAWQQRARPRKCALVRSAAAVSAPSTAYSAKCAHLRSTWSVIHGSRSCTTTSSAPLSAPLCAAGRHEWPQMTSSHTAAQTVRMRLARRFICPLLPSARGSCPPSTCGTWRHSCHCRRGGSARPR